MARSPFSPAPLDRRQFLRHVRRRGGAVDDAGPTRRAAAAPWADAPGRQPGERHLRGLAVRQDLRADRQAVRAGLERQGQPDHRAQRRAAGGEAHRHVRGRRYRWTSRSRPCSTSRATSTRASPRPSTGCPAWTSTSRTSRRSRGPSPSATARRGACPYFSTVWASSTTTSCWPRPASRASRSRAIPSCSSRRRKAKNDGVSQVSDPLGGGRGLRAAARRPGSA